MVLLDLSKAYDCISHELLLAKLAAYGLQENSLMLIRSFLTGRKQRVKINSTFSTLADVFVGIPQGSILGPLLFNVFINDLLLSYDKTELCNFADDNTLYSKDKDIEKLKANLMTGLNSILHWFKINEMLVNPEKFQIIFMDKRGGIHENISMTLNDNTILTSSKTVKLLGITFDQTLSFKNHINNLCVAASNKLKALLRIRRYLDCYQAKCLANSYIYSQFKYCNIIWMFCGKKLNHKINEIHKRTLRCVYKDYHLSFEELIKRYNEYSIHTKYLQSLMLFIYRILHRKSPDICVGSFRQNA